MRVVLFAAAMIGAMTVSANAQPLAHVVVPEEHQVEFEQTVARAGFSVMCSRHHDTQTYADAGQNDLIRFLESVGVDDAEYEAKSAFESFNTMPNTSDEAIASLPGVCDGILERG